MLRLLYSLGISFYFLAARLYACCNPKARAFTQGRDKLWRDLEQADLSSPLIWFHCASTGEFEQVRPVFEAIHREYPGHFFLLTFFSPSGYEVKKDYEHANLVTYLPADLIRNTRRFLELTRPVLAVFVKYDFWFNMLQQLERKKVPAVLVSGIFRTEQHFFRWYGKWQRGHLKAFRHLFLQDEHSARLLGQFGIDSVSVTGDTRFDRVIRVREAAPTEHVAVRLTEGDITLVAGSTWPTDEKALSMLLQAYPGMRLIIAPHEVSSTRIKNLMSVFAGYGSIATLSGTDKAKARVIVIDQVGLLSQLYQFGDIAYVGGGFGKGIHNTLEAATWGIPVLFGPEYRKFREAVQLIDLGGAVSIQDATSLVQQCGNWIDDPEARYKAGKAAMRYVDENSGATAAISSYLSRLLSGSNPGSNYSSE